MKAHERHRPLKLEEPPRKEHKIVYWHRDLPPIDAEAMGEHVVEAASARVPGTLDHRGELWENCYQDLMTQVSARLKQEINRLGGDYAHVLDECVDGKRDDSHGESWLHGEFTYVLYRRPSPQHDSSQP